MAERRAFEVVPDDPTPETAAQSSVWTEALFLFLKTLSQRTLIAIADCFTLITVSLVFWLWLRVIDKPSYEQIGALTIFSGFVLVVNMIVRSR